jgi:uncharacterized damage-inducible protein DinB
VESESIYYTFFMTFAQQLLLSDIHYSAWANQCLLDGCSAFTAEELERDLRLSHTSILATLRHTCDGERVWLDCLRDTPDRGTYLLPQTGAPTLSFDALKQNWPKLWDSYSHWFEGQSESTLGVELLVQLPDKEPHLPRWKILRHVLDHSQFHRGQIVAMIRSLGYCPPAINRMDYLLMTQAAKPESVILT